METAIDAGENIDARAAQYCEFKNWRVGTNPLTGHTGRCGNADPTKCHGNCDTVTGCVRISWRSAAAGRGARWGAARAVATLLLGAAPAAAQRPAPRSPASPLTRAPAPSRAPRRRPLRSKCPTSSCIANALGDVNLNCPNSARCPVRQNGAICDVTAYNGACTGGNNHCLGRVKCAAGTPCPVYEGMDCFYDGNSNNWKLCWSDGCFDGNSTATQSPVSVRLTKSPAVPAAPAPASCVAGSLGDLKDVGGEAFLSTLAATLNVYKVRGTPPARGPGPRPGDRVAPTSGPSARRARVQTQTARLPTDRVPPLPSTAPSSTPSSLSAAAHTRPPAGPH